MVKHLDNKWDVKHSTGVAIRAPETGHVVPNSGLKAAKWLCVCVSLLEAAADQPCSAAVPIYSCTEGKRCL